MFLVNRDRTAVFLTSLAALSCLILDHLLCPACVVGLSEMARRHRAQTDAGWGCRVSGRMPRITEAIALGT